MEPMHSGTRRICCVGASAALAVLLNAPQSATAVTVAFATNQISSFSVQPTGAYSVRDIGRYATYNEVGFFGTFTNSDETTHAGQVLSDAPQLLVSQSGVTSPDASENYFAPLFFGPTGARSDSLVSLGPLGPVWNTVSEAKADRTIRDEFSYSRAFTTYTNIYRLDEPQSLNISYTNAFSYFVANDDVLANQSPRVNAAVGSFVEIVRVSDGDFFGHGTVVYIKGDPRGSAGCTGSFEVRSCSSEGTRTYSAIDSTPSLESGFYRLTLSSEIVLLTPVPEPQTYVLMLFGLASLGGFAVRRAL